MAEERAKADSDGLKFPLDRLSAFERVKKLVLDDGVHYFEAARAAGLPFDQALAEAATNPEARALLELSKGRPRVEQHTEQAARDTITPAQMKQRSMEMLWNAGLFHKIGEMTAWANPETIEGQQVLLAILKHYAKDMMPKEMIQKAGSGSKLTAGSSIEEIEKQVDALQKKRVQLIEMKQRSKEAMRRLSQRGEADGGSTAG